MSLSSLTLHFHALHLQSYRNHVKEISGSFKDPARVDLAVLKKIVNFWRFQNGSMNLLGVTSEECCFLISLIMLLKHVYMGWKFHRTLKLDIFPFSLEHFLTSVEIFTQVAPAPIRFKNYFLIYSVFQTLVPPNLWLLLQLSQILNIFNVSSSISLNGLNTLSPYQIFAQIGNA